MTSFLKMSVVTCVYNAERFLERSLRSTLDQKYPNLELLIVDGGSSDRTLEIVGRVAPAARILHREPRGISDAMNAGAEAATGDVVAFMHADDMFEENALHRVNALFQQHPYVQWLYGRAAFVDDEDNVTDVFPAFRFDMSRMLRGNYIYHQATFMRLPFFRSTGGFDRTLRNRMDYEMWLRIGREHPPLVVKDVFCRYRIHGASASFGNTRRSNREALLVRLRYDSSPWKARIFHAIVGTPRMYVTTYMGLLKSRIWKHLPEGLRWKAVHARAGRLDGD
jgi:glycosyltransferase involved in cell wall biosynthesis